jgi:hypothetical protein
MQDPWFTVKQRVTDPFGFTPERWVTWFTLISWFTNLNWGAFADRFTLLPWVTKPQRFTLRFGFVGVSGFTQQGRETLELRFAA